MKSTGGFKRRDGSPCTIARANEPLTVLYADSSHSKPKKDSNMACMRRLGDDEEKGSNGLISGQLK